MMANRMNSTPSLEEISPDNIQSLPTAPARKELKLQKKLKFYFMNPCDKYRAKGRFPWKLVFQLVKIVFVTIQLVMFGFSRSLHVDFLEKSNVAFRHLFLKQWDPSFETLPYPPATGQYAIYKKPEFYARIDFVLDQYNQTDDIAIGTYEVEKVNGTKPPIVMCQTFYAKGFLHPSKQTYEYDAHKETECFDLGPVSKCNGTNCTEVFDTETYLDENHMNKTISFDQVIHIDLKFVLKTIHLRSLNAMSTPDCYMFNIGIVFDNSAHNGQMLISLKSKETSLPCLNGTIDYEGGFDDVYLGLSIFMDVLVIGISVISLILCIRSVLRGQLLKQETLNFFARYKGLTLSKFDKMEFLNLWYILIIINDILTVIGSILKICIETKTTHNYEACGVLLGTGNLLVWFGVLRYLGFFKKYNILILTMKKSAPNVVRFLVCAGVFYFGFAVCGWVVLGPYHLKFASLSITSESLFSMMNGDGIFETDFTRTTPDFIWWYSRVFTYTFMTLFCYIVLNLFIAIILDAYEVIKFRHLSTSSECLFSLVNGDDMFVTFSIIGDDKPYYIWWFSRAYLYIFVSLFIYVILNLFIAVILDTYEVLKHYHDNPQSELFAFVSQCPEDAFGQIPKRNACTILCCCIPSNCCCDRDGDEEEEVEAQPTERTYLLSSTS